MRIARRLCPLVLLVAVFLLAPARAEVRRAVLVGINEYTGAPPAGYQFSPQTQLRLKAIAGTAGRRPLRNLGGAVNDASAMREILIQRFGFEPRHIILLSDREASADRILATLQTHLIDNAKAGDVSLFYYAGHGSRIRNTALRNPNLSGFDSTLVPADAFLGVPDVRSKELARIFVQAPRKGVSLTVIEDTCYSGGASRGAFPRGRIRAEPPASGISVDETLQGPLPEDEGVLVISAAQDYETAAELPDSDLAGPHGAFTWALLHVLGASSEKISADRIFQRTRALMQAVAPDQEPVLLAKKNAGLRSLFGQPADAGIATVAVAQVKGKTIRLNAGLAMNLHEDCELKRVAPRGSPVSIRITSVTGLSSANAEIVSSSPADTPVSPGDLFQLEKWVVPDREILRVYVGDPAPETETSRALDLARTLRRSSPNLLGRDPTVDPPTHVLGWNAARSQWGLQEDQFGSSPVWINPLSASRVLGLLPQSARLFILMPPSRRVLERLQLGPSVSIVDSPERADYALVGRPCNSPELSCVEYAWTLPHATEKDVLAGRLARPLRSDWFEARDNAETPAPSLTTAALALAKIVGWLNLAEPVVNQPWPYRLVLRNAQTGQILSKPEVRDGERYKLMLRAAPGAQVSGLPPRRVYVFVVDSFGQATFLFGDNLQNEFPRPGESEPPELIPLTGGDADLSIGPPFGIDNYFLLTSSTPIDDPRAVFNISGIRTRGAGAADPLSQLLQNISAAKRGGVKNVPLNWSIEHFTLLSRPNTQ